MLDYIDVTKHHTEIAELPAVLQEVAESVGLDLALSLASKHGGTRIFIPKRLPSGHWLTQSMGLANATRLSQEFGGNTLAIPRAIRVLRRVRNKEIAQRYDDGENVRTLARVYSLTDRQIYSILSGRHG